MSQINLYNDDCSLSRTIPENDNLGVFLARAFVNYITGINVRRNEFTNCGAFVLVAKDGFMDFLRCEAPRIPTLLTLLLDGESHKGNFTLDGLTAEVVARYLDAYGEEAGISFVSPRSYCVTLSRSVSPDVTMNYGYDVTRSAPVTEAQFREIVTRITLLCAPGTIDFVMDANDTNVGIKFTQFQRNELERLMPISIPLSIRSLVWTGDHFDTYDFRQ